MPEPKLLKRTTTTTTEEFADDLDLDEADDLDGLKCDEECEPARKGSDSTDERSRRRK